MDEIFSAAFAAKAQQCPLRTHWISFRLVDEFGSGAPYADLHYLVIDGQGQEVTGILNGDGYALVDNCYSGPFVLRFSDPYQGGTDIWYERLMIRENYPLPITALQVAAEHTLRRPSSEPSASLTRAVKEKAEFYRVEVRDLVEITSHLPPASTLVAPRPSKVLAANARQNGVTFGVALEPNKHHVLEVRALRAWRPLLSLTPTFSALDAYQLALFTNLAYAGFGQKYDESEKQPPTYPVPGTVGHVLNARLGNIQTGALIEEPGRFHRAQGFYPILEEVPYSKRLEVVPYDPQRYTKHKEQLPWDLHTLDHTDSNTQAYVTHDDRMILIGVRGTQENPDDLMLDLDAAQVPYEEGIGQAHQGFYRAFKAVKAFVEPYLLNFHTGQKIVVCGHSLGGAIALLLAEWIRRNEQKHDVLLYTFGAPRAGDRAFVEGASALVHHRLVNHNDPIPSLPATWMDTDKRLWIPGLAALITGTTGVGGAAFLAGVVNLQGDPYQHHGTQHHFLPLKIAKDEETSLLWQPACSGIENAAGAHYAAKTTADMPDRATFVAQLASVKQHYMASYISACHNTILRWKTATETMPSTYLTAREEHWLREEIESYHRKLENWERQARRRYEADHRYSGSLVTHREKLEQAISEAMAERRRLPRTLARIKLLAEQYVDKAQLYGVQATNPQLESLIARWQEHERNLPTLRQQQAQFSRAISAHHAQLQ
ncbi:lipase family protein [Pseudomonas sp. B392_1p]|uniref:lipase family protein n=1 Tax=Pseudomonas sp. B392_1p TaxID=3457507 RepID=UPI003FD3F759